MDQAPLYAAVNEAGFSVLEFSDHPNFFGCWYIVVKRGHEIFRIVHEGRDSWLLFYRQSEPDKWEELAQVESHTMSNEALTQQTKSWLLGVRT